MTNRRMLALLLAGLLTAGALTACGSTEDKPETNIPNAENGETVQETEPETEPDPFEGTDFGGKSLRINSSNDFTDSTLDNCLGAFVARKKRDVDRCPFKAAAAIV